MKIQITPLIDDQSDLERGDASPFQYEGGSREENVDEDEAGMDFEDQREEDLRSGRDPYETSMNPD